MAIVATKLVETANENGQAQEVEHVILSLSSSQAEDLRTCEQKYIYSTVRNLQPIVPSLPMKVGTWVHLLYAAFWRSKMEHPGGGDWPTWRDAHEFMVQQWESNLVAEQREAIGDIPGTSLRLFESYLWHYTKLCKGDGMDFEVIAVEMPYKFLVRVNQHVSVEVTATVDLVGRDRNGQYFLMDLKTGDNFPNTYDLSMTEVPISLQMMACRANGIDISYAIYDYIRRRPPVVPKINKDGSLRKGEISTDYRTFMLTLRENKIDPAPYQDQIAELKDPERSKFFKREIVHRNERVLKEAIRGHVQTALRTKRLRSRPETAVRSQSRFRCGMCPFKALCHAELYNDNVEYVLQTRYQERNDERRWLWDYEDEGDVSH
jgi:hypothetical protein